MWPYYVHNRVKLSAAIQYIFLPRYYMEIWQNGKQMASKIKFTILDHSAEIRLRNQWVALNMQWLFIEYNIENNSIKLQYLWDFFGLTKILKKKNYGIGTKRLDGYGFYCQWCCFIENSYFRRKFRKLTIRRRCIKSYNFVQF